MTEAPGGRRLVIAIDGPAGAGKSTAARALAARLGYRYVDSGAMYRVVGLAAREHGVDPGDGAALAALVDGLAIGFVDEPAGTRVTLGDRDVTAQIRDPDASEWASRVAAVSAVRTRLVALQRRLAVGGGVVMEGRDIGTVVLPDADCKFFLTASTEVRARRRLADPAAGASGETLTATQHQIERRDQRDRERADSPLRTAADAIVVDTTVLTPEVVVQRLAEVVQAGAST